MKKLALLMALAAPALAQESLGIYSDQLTMFTGLVNSELGRDCISLTRHGRPELKIDDQGRRRGFTPYYSAVLDWECLAAAVTDQGLLDGPQLDEPAPSTGELVLSWDAPTTRENGEALVPGELGGYRLNWSIDGVAQPAIELGPDVTSYTITDPAPGEHAFAIAAYDSAGVYSDLSETVTATISQ